MPVTLNGRVWQLSDFLPYGFATNWMPFFEDLIAELTGFQGGTLRDQAAASAASAATSARLAEQAAGSAGTGTATGLTWPAAAKSLLTASDVVAVGIYSGSMDSDGGEWRRRKIGSWSLETLNTATRGATRDFPRYAGWIARKTSFTVYDLSDLDASGLPRMWMVFNGSGTAVPMNGTTYLPTAAHCLNGRIYLTIGGTSGCGVMTLDFAGDVITVRDAGTYSRRNANIAGRNSAGVTQIITTASSALLVSTVATAVHARVLPGAPLDSAGLPIPTVVVATSAGVSVIHPNGAVYDIARAAGYAGVHLGASGLVYAQQLDSNPLEFGPLPYADIANSAWRRKVFASNTVPAVPVSPNANRVIAVTADVVALGSTGSGLALLAIDPANPDASMVSLISINSATGWVPGDARGVWLGGADTGSITGAVLLNDDCSSATGWTLTAGWTLDAVNTEFDHSTGTTALSRAWSGATVGQSYLVAVTTGNRSAGSLTISATGGAITGQISVTTDGVALITLTATATSGSLVFTPTTDFNGSVQAVRADLCVPDLSVKGKGLIVRGSLLRTALPCGLSYYTGFSTSVDLSQPFSADQNYSSGLFVSAWVRPDTTSGVSRTIVGRGPAGWTGARWRFILGSANTLYAELSDGSVTVTASGVTAINDDRWHLAAMIWTGSTVELWLDGVREASVSASSLGSLANASGILGIGLLPSGSGSWAGAMMLPTVSATPPIPAQIRRKFTDERAMILGGAPAVLGGTSNNVVALAANDATGTLAVGTGDGVTVVDGGGLCRGLYLDGASGGAAIANDAITALAASGDYLLVGTSAGAGLISDSVIARDRIGGSIRPAPRLDEIKLSGVTTDASATLLTPLLWVGERETGAARLTLTARVYGPTATENGVWSLSARFSRDAGGSVAILTEADSQGAVRWDTGTPGAEPWTDKTSGAMALAIVTSGTEYIGAQVTGLGATRVEWEGTLTWERIARDQRYVA